MGHSHDIEFADAKYSTCECCGETSTHLVRYVSVNGDARAVYLADFSPGHDYVSILASFGGWGGEEGEFGPDDRTAIAVKIWTDESNFQVGIVDPENSGYQGKPYFGRILPRQEALDHPLKQELFDLTDHIVECDRPIVEFLEGKVP